MPSANLLSGAPQKNDGPVTCLDARLNRSAESRRGDTAEEGRLAGRGPPGNVAPTKRLQERPASPLHQPSGKGLVAQGRRSQKKAPPWGRGLKLPKGLAAYRQARRR